MPATLVTAQRTSQWIGLLAGPILAAIVYALLPAQYTNAEGVLVEFTLPGRMTLAVMSLMAVWWLTEAIDISATALLPIALFPLLSIASIKEATAPYGSDIIFLFMGGFLLALCMQRWGLDRRIALITLRLVGTRPPAMIGGFMLVTAALSMWVSNTATAAMMLPIALSVIDLVLRKNAGASLNEQGGLPAEGVPGRNFALSLMLGIAYAASIGGIGTIIGSPPNAFLVQYIGETYGREISFMQWMTFGLPVVIIFLPIAWIMITWVLYPIKIKHIEGGRELIDSEFHALGPMKPGEWAAFIVFICTALLWIFRPLLVTISIGEGDALFKPLAGLSDPGIAILAGIVLFIIPVNLKRGTFALNWHTAQKLPWGILILFGGGLSLAAAVTANGVADYLGAQVASFTGAPALLLVLFVVAIVIFLTELTSNIATTAALVPILAALAPGLGVDPYLLIVPATIAASCAFMMPVATPPNAIVFAAGYITIPQMCKAGFWLNLLGVGIITVLAFAIIAPLLRG